MIDGGDIKKEGEGSRGLRNWVMISWAKCTAETQRSLRGIEKLRYLGDDFIG